MQQIYYNYKFTDSTRPIDQQATNPKLFPWAGILRVNDGMQYPIDFYQKLINDYTDSARLGLGHSRLIKTIDVRDVV